MELVYLWVENYKNIHKQGFNFSPRFECNYDGENLTLTSKEHIENFFGKNINVTAIVGENGSGKSGVLEVLVNSSEKLILYIFYVNKVLKYFSNHKINTNIESIPESLFNDFKSKYFTYISMSPFENTIQEGIKNLSIADEEFTTDAFNNYQAFASSVLLTQVKYKNILLKEFGINEPHTISLTKNGNAKSLLINSEEFNQYFSNDPKTKDITFEFYEKDGTLIRFSSGEKAILYYLSSLLYIQEKIENDTVVLFDEIELFLHPMWQQRILNIFLRIIEEMPNKRAMHLIVPSHSPFILSDIPKENVIFLEKDEATGNCKNVTKETNIETFGANIHTLLSHGFFMKDGLMGEFAKEKIETIKKFYEKVKDKNNNIKDLKEEYEQTKDTFTNIQSIIGEPFLKAIMGNYLDELHLIFSDKKTLIDKELIELEKRKQSLKSLKNAKN